MESKYLKLKIYFDDLTFDSTTNQRSKLLKDIKWYCIYTRYRCESMLLVPICGILLRENSLYIDRERKESKAYLSRQAYDIISKIFFPPQNMKFECLGHYIRLRNGPCSKCNINRSRRKIYRQSRLYYITYCIVSNDTQTNNIILCNPSSSPLYVCMYVCTCV